MGGTKPPLHKGALVPCGSAYRFPWLLRCGNGGPGEAQRQRVRRGEEEQRNERAFALKAKREIWSLRRRGHNTPQNGQITFQTFPGKWGKIATAGRGSPRGEAERKGFMGAWGRPEQRFKEAGTKGLHPFAKAPAKS